MPRSSAYSKAGGSLNLTSGGVRGSRSRSSSEPRNRVRSGTAMRDANGNLMEGEYNAATGKRLGSTDPNPTRIKTPSIASASRVSDGNSTKTAASGMIGSTAFRMAGVQPAQQSALGTPMPGIPESRSPVTAPRMPGQSISPTQIALNQSRRTGAPTSRTLTAEQAVTAFGGSTRPTSISTRPDGTRSIAGQYGTGSTVATHVAVTPSQRAMTAATSTAVQPQRGMADLAAAKMKTPMSTASAPAANRNSPFMTRAAGPTVKTNGVPPAATVTKTTVAAPSSVYKSPTVITQRGVAMPAPKAEEPKKKGVYARGRYSPS